MAWRRLALAALALAALVLPGSAGAARRRAPTVIKVTTPLRAEQLTWMPLSIELDLLASADLGSLVVRLNGVDITSLFTLEPPANGRVRANADFVWAPGLVLQGANTLDVRIVSDGLLKSLSRPFSTEGDPYADAVAAFAPGPGAGFGQAALPDVVLGPPRGGGLFDGSLDVVSLGQSGSIELEFVDNVIVDGPGVDLIVFENAFLEIAPGLLTGNPFTDPGRVEVSQDGVSWSAFTCPLVPEDGPLFPGCSGVYPVLSDAGDPTTPHASIPTSEPIENLIGVDALTIVPPPGAGGDAFDLALVGLPWVRFVRIVAADFVPGPAGPDNFGFDLDAAAAVNAAPATDLDGNGIPDAVE